MNHPLLDDALDDLVDRCDEAFGNWDDVLDRAGIAVVEPVRRAVVVATFAAVLTTLFFVTPAFGLLKNLIDRTNVSFRGGTTAPLEVKRNFFDLSLGAPPSDAPDAIAAQTRRVATFHVNGKAHVLWVAPTRKGGYCWQFDGGLEGCRRERSIAPAVSASWAQIFPPRGTPSVQQVEGDLLGRAAASLTLVYANGRTTPIRFVYVSPPIDAGFFFSRVPAGHESVASRATALVLRDKDGRILAKQTFRYETPASLARERKARAAMLKRFERLRRDHTQLPIVKSPPLPAPTAPQQRGSTKGVSVVAGRNGVAIFDTTGASAATKKLIAGREVGYGCVVRVPFHAAPVDLLSGRTTFPHVGIRVQGAGVRPPFLGCDVQGTYGHTWPDRLRGHSAIEIPFGAAGRSYFADRAAARDLSLFVSGRRMHKIRKATGAALVQQLRARYGSALVQSAPPAAGRVGYTTRAGGVTFYERSTTGRLFYVRIRGGRIAGQNVKPLAFVF